MIIDDVDISDLPENSEEAFIDFEKRLRISLEKASRNDRDENIDQNGNYVGSHTPERYYVSSIRAFLDEYDLDIDVEDISTLDDATFPHYFRDFFNRINYARTRLSLHKQRSKIAGPGTQILIGPTYKDEINNLLGTIRKIVNQEIIDENKKDAIFTKIAALQLEIDRDRTTIDALFSRMIDLTKTVGECAENVEPLVEKLERIMKLFLKGTEKTKLLPKKERPKLISKEADDTDQVSDDEIPF